MEHEVNAKGGIRADNSCNYSALQLQGTMVLDTYPSLMMPLSQCSREDSTGWIDRRGKLVKIIILRNRQSHSIPEIVNERVSLTHT